MIPNEVDNLREVPIAEVLKAVGLTPRPEGKSVMWKDGHHSINVTGQKWFDHEAGKGGYGAIDLVKHLCGVDFQAAVKWLQAFESSPIAKDLSYSAPPPISLLTITRQPPPRADEFWPTAHSYLVKVRSIPSSIVDRLYESNDIYAVQNGVVFIHRNLRSEVSGCSIRSSWHAGRFRQCLGSKQQAWFSTEGTNFPWHEPNRPIAIVESAIEALSYATLHEVACISISGNHVPDELVRLLGHQSREVILALNSDTPGQRGTLAAIERFEALGSDLRAQISAHRPRLKDWNNDLQASLKQQLSM